jgi:hypothetical protein
VGAHGGVGHVDVGAGQVPQLGERGGLPIQNHTHVTSSHRPLPSSGSPSARAPANKLGPRACIRPRPSCVQASCDWRSGACSGPPPLVRRRGPALRIGLSPATAAKPAAAAHAGQPVFCAARRRHRPPASTLSHPQRIRPPEASLFCHG